MVSNNCNDIDFTKPKRYLDKDWKALQDKKERCKGKIKRFKASSADEWTEVRKGKLFHEKDLVWKNDKGIWGCDYSNEFGRNCATATFVDAMKDIMIPFKVKRRSNGKLITLNSGNTFR